MEELLKQLLSKEFPIMKIELTQTILGTQLKGGFTGALDIFCAMNDVKKEDVEALYYKFLKQPIGDFAKGLDELLVKAGNKTEMLDLSKED